MRLTTESFASSPPGPKSFALKEEEELRLKHHAVASAEGAAAAAEYQWQGGPIHARMGGAALRRGELRDRQIVVVTLHFRRDPAQP
jgi:hypothetical protein